MFLQVKFSFKGFKAYVTYVIPLLAMRDHVTGEGLTGFESFEADATHVIPLSHVGFHVSHQVPWGFEPFPALLARVGSFI